MMTTALAFGCNTGTESGSSGASFADSDILVARSTDGGVTWTQPAELNVDAATDLGADEAPQLTTDTGGTWLSVWQSTSFDALVRTDFDILVSGSVDDGFTWTGQAELNSNAGTDQPAEGDLAPQLTTDTDGSWVAVWQSTVGYNLPSPPPPALPIEADLDILVARSTDDGATWTAQVALNSLAATDIGMDESPQVTTDGAGIWVAVWNSNQDYNQPCRPQDTCPPDKLPDTDFDILVARSADDGATWTAQVALNSRATADGRGLPNNGGTDKNPQVTTDGNGVWVAVWNSDDGYNAPRDPDHDILAARSMDGGATWTAQVNLNTNAGIDFEDDLLPQLTTDRQGVWVAVWESKESLGDTIGTDADILVARSSDDGATWTAPAPLNSNAASDTGQDQAPQLTTDAQGAWIATWHSRDSLGGTIGTDADILVARSMDDGVTWTAPAPLNTNAADDSEDDNSPQVTTDESGAWVAVWQSAGSL